MSTSGKSYWLKSGLFSIFEKGSVFLFGFGGFYIIARAFSKEDFGVWVLYYTLISFLEVARIGLLGNGLVRFINTCEEDAKPLVHTASLFLNVCLTVLFVVTLLLAGPMMANLLEVPVLTALFQIYCITTCVLVPFYQFMFIQQANMDFKGIFWMNFAQKGMFFSFILFLFITKGEFTLFKLVYFQIITAIVGGIIGFVFARKYLQFAKEISNVWVSKLFHFGRFVFGTNLSTMFYKSVDKLMLGYFLTPVAVGVYEWAIKITNLVEVPTFSIASVAFPKAAQLHKEEGISAVKRVYEKSVGIILALVIPFLIGVFIFAEPIIIFLASEKFIDTVPVLRVTILFGFIVPYAIQVGTVLDSIGKPKINFYFTICGVFINIISNAFFITQFGVIGAAYGTLTAYSIVFIISQVLLHRIAGVNTLMPIRYAIGYYGEAFNMVRNGQRFAVSKQE